MKRANLKTFKSWLSEKRPELVKVFLGYPLISNTQKRKENWKRINNG